MLVYVLDMRQRSFVFISEAARHLLGYSPEQLSGSNAPPVDELLLEHVDDTGADATYGRSVRIAHPSGDDRWLLLRESWLDLDNGLRLGVGIDVTSARRARAELGLYRSLARVLASTVERLAHLPARTAADNVISDALAMIGLKIGADECHLCRFTSPDCLPIRLDVTHQWNRDLSRPVCEELQDLPVNLIHGLFEKISAHEEVYLTDREDFDRADRVLRGVLQGRQASGYVALPLVIEDVTWGYFGLVRAPFSFVWDDDIVSMLKQLGQIFVSQIKYHQARERLVESREELDQFANAAYDLVLIMDEETLISAARTKRDDIPRHEYENKRLYNLIDTSSYRPLYEAVHVAMGASSVADGANEVEYRAPGPDRQIVWFRGRVCPVIQDRKAVGVALYATVIQTQMEHAERIRRLDRDLDRASRLNLLGHSATEIAHELNQPLQVISGYAEGLQMRVQSGEAGPAEIVEMLARIRNSSTLAAERLRTIRSFVHQKEAESRRISVDEIIRSTLELASPSLRAHQVVLDCYVTPHLPEVCVNPAQLIHVLLNLIMNGIEAASADLLLDDIRIQIAARLQTEHKLQITVTDNGPGVAETDREAIFNRYFTTKPAGLGIGLSTSRSAVKSYGGSLEINPQRPFGNRGAEFLLTIPRAADESE